MKRLRELERVLQEIENNIQIEKAQKIDKLTKEELTNYYKLALEKEPKILINYLVKEIKLFDDKIKLYLTHQTIALTIVRAIDL